MDLAKKSIESGRFEQAAPLPELTPEKRQELPAREQRGAAEGAVEPQAPVQAAVSKEKVPEIPKDPVLKQVEEFLSEDLLELYAEMPPVAQAQFKSKGEEVAFKIKAMIEGARIVAKEVLELITSWLRTIPGVNKFFLEQEAKIKTDKIIAFAEEESKK